MKNIWLLILSLIVLIGCGQNATETDGADEQSADTETGIVGPAFVLFYTEN